VRRSQQGNNNAYCQDSKLSWFDWHDVDRHADLLGFVKKLIDFTQSHEIFTQEQILAVSSDSKVPYIIWHGIKLGEADWSYHSNALAFTLCHPTQREHLHVLLNAYWEPLTFELPPLRESTCWHQIINTAFPSPHDFCEPQTALRIEGGTYNVTGRSIVVLMAF